MSDARIGQYSSAHICRVGYQPWGVSVHSACRGTAIMSGCTAGCEPQDAAPEQTSNSIGGNDAEMCNHGPYEPLHEPQNATVPPEEVANKVLDVFEVILDYNTSIPSWLEPVVPVGMLASA